MGLVDTSTSFKKSSEAEEEKFNEVVDGHQIVIIGTKGKVIDHVLVKLVMDHEVVELN